MKHSAVPGDRLDNEQDPEKCTACRGDAQVVAYVRRDRKVKIAVTHGRVDQELVEGEYVDVEEMAPCPVCSRGYRLEFGFGWKTDKFGKRVETVNDRPRWGKDGFWRGRTWDPETGKVSAAEPLFDPAEIEPQREEGWWET